MIKQPVRLILVLLAALLGATTPAYAHSFEGNSFTSVNAFGSAPVDDQSLASATGGFADLRGNLHVIVRETLDQSLSLQAGIGNMIMDNWFAADGADLLAAGRLTAGL